MPSAADFLAGGAVDLDNRQGISECLDTFSFSGAIQTLKQIGQAFIPGVNPSDYIPEWQSEIAAIRADVDATFALADQTLWGGGDEVQLNYLHKRWAEHWGSATPGSVYKTYDDCMLERAEIDTVDRIYLAMGQAPPVPKRRIRGRNVMLQSRAMVASTCARSAIGQPDAAATVEGQRHYQLAYEWTRLRSGVAAGEVEEATHEMLQRHAEGYLDAVAMLGKHLGSSSPGGAAVQQTVKTVQFKKLFVAIAKWKPRLGFEPLTAMLAAALLNVLKNVHSAFRAFCRIYEDLQLDDYFAPPIDEATDGTQLSLCLGTALRHDAQQVWQDLWKLFPMVPRAFNRHGMREVFMELAEGLLRSLLMCCHHLERQSLASYVRLLDRVLSAEKPKTDPRRNLRYAVLCIFGRRWREFGVAAAPEAGPEAMEAAVAQLRDGMDMDTGVLDLFDARLLPGTVASGWHAATTMPIGGMIGWYVVHDSTADAVDLIGGAIDVSYAADAAILVGAIGFATGVALGAVVGAVASSRLLACQAQEVATRRVGSSFV